LLIALHHDVLILGASTRSAAFSALRCGLRPRCADYFADRDLAAICVVDRIDPRHAGHQFTELADTLPSTPWFYTGGFENHPRWVEHVSARHSLWGVDAQVLRAVRDPALVALALGHQGIPCPSVRRDLAGAPTGQRWLKKPLASGGGRGIEAVTHRNSHGSPSHYFQEWIDGPSFSALYIGERGRCRLVGVTRQLIGTDNSPFSYVGSVGPIVLGAALGVRLQSLGDALTSAFDLTGWFGIDYVLRDEIPWPVEINPRYTASLEIHELAHRRSLVAEHRLACEPGQENSTHFPALTSTPARIIAKAILYAPRKLVAPDIIADENGRDDLFAIATIADIPWPGTCFQAGEPVMTLVAQGANLADCRLQMLRLVDHWSEQLGIAGDERTIATIVAHSW
jgi:predicted ATP-grasp superfamily ATP-dependent carboligase